MGRWARWKPWENHGKMAIFPGENGENGDFTRENGDFTREMVGCHGDFMRFNHCKW